MYHLSVSETMPGSGNERKMVVLSGERCCGHGSRYDPCHAGFGGGHVPKAAHGTDLRCGGHVPKAAHGLPLPRREMTLQSVYVHCTCEYLEVLHLKISNL